MTGPGGRPILVPKPEHLIAVKLHAFKNDPERLWQDLADIGFDVLTTPTDVAVLRQFRSESPSWLMIDWRVLAAQVPPGALDRRPIANQRWQPFVLT